VVGGGNLMAALSPLPPAALRLDPVVTPQLHALGVNTIGLLLKIPRKELAARFGPGILERIDQATGDVAEVLNWLPHRAPIRAQIEFEGAVESLEAIHLALRELLGPITQQLARRELGARELQLTFRPGHAPPVEKLIRLSRPSRGQMDLFSLIQHATQNLEIDEGIAAVGLFVSAASPLGDEQTDLIGGEPQRNAAELDHLLERLRARLGEVAQWAQLVESHLPERAFRCDQSPAYPCGAADKQRFGRDQSPACTCGAADKQIAARPLCLLPIPRRVQAIVTPSESRDGQPISFTDDGQVHRLAHVKGPERIAGEWWNGRWKTRDYFDAQDDAGNRYWLFRVVQSGQWYLHGIFE
jgi:protein ImuB